MFIKSTHHRKYMLQGDLFERRDMKLSVRTLQDGSHVEHATGTTVVEGTVVRVQRYV